MNKKAFIGATLITATVVGGVVYFRHKILEQVDKWLDTEPMEHDPEAVLDGLGRLIRKPETDD